VPLTGTGLIAPRPVTLSLGGLSKVFNNSVVYNSSAADLAALSALLGVSGNTVTAIDARFDDITVGTGKTVRFSNALISDGNNGNNFAVTFLPTHNNRIERLSTPELDTTLTTALSGGVVGVLATPSPVVPSSTQPDLLLAPAAPVVGENQNVLEVSGGLRFVDLAFEEQGSAPVTTVAQAPTGDAPAGNGEAQGDAAPQAFLPAGGSRDGAGFLNVFVVNGGINLPTFAQAQRPGTSPERGPDTPANNPGAAAPGNTPGNTPGANPGIIPGDDPEERTGALQVSQGAASAS